MAVRWWDVVKQRTCALFLNPESKQTDYIQLQVSSGIISNDLELVGLF